jgi:hypothetical protein
MVLAQSWAILAKKRPSRVQKIPYASYQFALRGPPFKCALLGSRVHPFSDRITYAVACHPLSMSSNTTVFSEIWP